MVQVVILMTIVFTMLMQEFVSGVVGSEDKADDGDDAMVLLRGASSDDRNIHVGCVWTTMQCAL